MQEFDLLTHTLEPATTLIEASAGTGKTYNIQHLYLRFVVEKNMAPDRLLVVTFSNEATAELKLRIARNLSCAEEVLLKFFSPSSVTMDTASIDPSLLSVLVRVLEYTEYDEVLRRVQFALRAMDEAAILTIHSFCLRVLTEFAFESGALFGVELIENRNSLFADLVGDFMKREVVYLESIQGRLLREFISLDFIAEIPPVVYGKDDVEILGRNFELPDLSDLYKVLRFIDFDVTRFELKKNKGSKANALLDFLEHHEALTESNMMDFISFINGDLMKSVVKTKYFEKVFSVEFQEAIRLFRSIPDVVCFNLYKKFSVFLEEYYLTSCNAEDNAKLAFDDILYMTRGAIKREGSNLSREVRRAYSAVLVDEFQDTSGVQFDIFNSLFGSGTSPFFMIGDPKQSIYAFRGADIFSYLKAVNAEGVIRSTLSKNFRSTPEYIDALNLLFENRDSSEEGVSLPFIFPEIGYINIDAGRTDDKRLFFADNSEALEFRWLGAGKELATGKAESLVVKSVAGDIAKKLNLSLSSEAYFMESGAVSELKPSDFAVLVDTNRQGEEVRKELNRRGIVAVVLKSGNVFDSREALELSVILRAIINSRNEGAVMAALGTRCFCYSSTNLAKIKECEAGLREYWFEFFAELNDILLNYGFLQAFSTFFTRSHLVVSCESAKAVLAASPSGERSVTNYLQLVEILEQELLLLGGSDEQVLVILQDKILEASKNQEYEMRLESDEDAVKIMTVHKSKGLQFPIVYVPFLYKAAGDFTKFDRPLTCNLAEESKIGVILSESERQRRLDQLLRNDRAEKMRLLYVALTRAVDKCIVYGGNIKSIQDSPLADVLGKDFARLEYLSANSNIAVVSNWDDGGDRYRPDAQELDMSAKEFGGCIERDWGVMSYSSLVSHDFVSIDVRSDATLLGSDVGEDGLLDITDNLAPLPSSNKVGSAVHEILEEYDFSSITDSFADEGILNKLKKYGVLSSGAGTGSSDKQIAGIRNILSIVSKLPLEDVYNNSFTLSHIPAKNCVPEMSFYFPVRERISTSRLSEFFKRRGLAQYRGDGELTNVLAGLGLAVQEKGFREGFLYGLIDLVFEHNGRFYFADWKTNNLSRYGGYGSAAVLASMGESGYLLQFYIYTVALNLFLRSRIIDFDYQTHFGGGYYLYLRGLDLVNPLQGVFYEAPSESDVNELIDIFTGGSDER